MAHHHENLDGTGYPAGLAGESIPLRARILAVADAYDAMSSSRPYRRRLSPEQIDDIFAKGAGVPVGPEGRRGAVRLPCRRRADPLQGARRQPSSRRRRYPRPPRGPVKLGLEMGTGSSSTRSLSLFPGPGPLRIKPAAPQLG